MPAKSKKQQKAMGMALAVKRGKMPMEKAGMPVKKMAMMSEDKLKEFAGTKRKGLPNKKKKGRKEVIVRGKKIYG